ncbi:MAG: glycosyltransferase family 4 protein [Flavobacteriales bacterium]|jgi:glycosyltransferase involved in cell wall biosynthesis
MKLLLITDGISPFVIGGMQKHSANIARFMVERGHEVTVVHCVPHGTSLPTEEEVKTALSLPPFASITSIVLHFPQPAWYPGHYLKESYAYSVKIYQKLKGQWDEFDFIYAKGFSAWRLIEAKRKGEKMPPIGVKFHGYEMFQKAQTFNLWLQHQLLQGPTKWNSVNADYVFSYGGQISEIAERIGVAKNKIIELPSGIELSWIKQDRVVSDRIRFVFVGRFERRKGVEELNQALQALSPELQYEFHFIGPIPPSARLSDSRITYHGEIKDKNQILSIIDSCNVLVAPSHSEGMPNVILEGMSRGCAILTTLVGAVPILVDEGSGWFVKPGDAVDLKNQLIRILEIGPEGVHLKGVHALTRISESFTWEKVAERLEKMLLSRL